MGFELYRLNWILSAMAASAISVAGCNSPASDKPATASKSQGEKKIPSGKPIEPSPPVAKRLPAEPAEMPLPAAAPEKPQPTESAAPPPAMPAAAAPAEVGQLDPLDLIMPPVLMTAREAKTCLVNVGDTLPEVRLPKPDGSEELLKDLYGQRLTVVLFWKASQPYAVEELGDLQRLVAKRFADKQVNVVGIDVQDRPEVVQETVAAKKIEYPVLIDATGAALAQVASGLLPRTYLVDRQGKILWFDMEYSRSTRRDLVRAIRATLSMND